MGIFLTAAIITPSGDPISMMALAVPMTFLYAISVGIGYFIQWRRKKASNV
jgi:sec-independent protein translocase protein TatC